MLKFRIVGAALILSAAIATPALAEVVQEPGNLAFFYPNADLGLGYSKPVDTTASQPARSGELSSMRMSVKIHRANRAPAIKHY
jgi:hypothetical protein